MAKKKSKQETKKRPKEKHVKAKGVKGVKEGKGGKKGAPAKGADTPLVCPCCSKHCPLSKPRCGKGKRLAAKTREHADAEGLRKKRL